MTLAEEKVLLARFAKTAGAGEMLNIYETGELGIDRAVKLLDATLQEEKKTAPQTQLAVTVINHMAEAA